MAGHMTTNFNLEHIVRRHQSQVWWYLRLLGADPATADDVTQDTFVAVMRRPFDDYEPRATAAYLRTVAKRTYFALLKQQKRSPEVVSADFSDQAWAACLEDNSSFEALWQHLTHGEVTEADAFNRKLQALKSCLGVLAPKAREALRLRYEERESRERTAQLLGMTSNGVKSLLQRSRAALRDCIERKIQ